MESLILGNDSDVLNQMIPFYCGVDSFNFVDVTCNKRKMWKKVEES